MYSVPNNYNAKDENGETVIPASQRPDGTWRKARRVKEGYVPQEEVPLYESKGKQLQNRHVTATSPLAPGQTAHKTIPGLFIQEPVEKPVKSKKKAKKSDVGEVTKQVEKVKISETTNTEKVPKNPKIETKSSTNVAVKIITASVPDSQQSDPAKKLKNLKKRLREIEALEEKLQSGNITNPEPEQLTKLKRKPDLLVEIYNLEKLV